MASIALEHVVKRYEDGFVAVDDVSLEVADGEFVILVGPSGCGKSTILRLVVGLEEISAGELRIDGERSNEKSPRDRNLALVFQSYALYPHLTVFENIAFPLRIARRFGEEEVRRKVEETAALLDLREQLGRKPAQLSGGQRQRVAMGRALVRDARAFLFDEPLSNLDARLRGQMRAEIARLQRRLGATMLYVTHDQTEAMTLGDRVAVLRRGRLQQLAAPRTLYERPANLFVAGFIGSPPMNLVPARVEGGVLALPFAQVALPEAMAAGTAGRACVIAGIRPEHFEDAARIDTDARARGVVFRALVDVTEWLGSEQYGYVPFEVSAELAAPLSRLAHQLDAESPRTQLVVSVAAESRIREGEPAALWLDPHRLHLFDPDTGENLLGTAP